MKRLLVIALALLATSLLHAQAREPNGEHKFVRRGVKLAPFLEHDSTHSFDVRFYRLDLNLPMDTDAMQAHERVTVTSRRAGLDSVAFHMQRLVCDSAKIGGVSMFFAAGSGMLYVALDRQYNPGESLSIDIFYHRDAGTPQQGFYWYQIGPENYHVICYSTTEPQDSRYWFPCYDEPWDKAEQGCAISITLPDSLSACSNGLLDSVTTHASDHTATYWWSEHHPISTYLMTFAASKWATFKQWFHTQSGDSLYLQNFVWPEDSAEAVGRTFTHNVDMMEFFLDSLRYGPYPFEKYGMVEAGPFQWGGMENQTMTMVHYWWVQSGDDDGIAHEMSHQWWGDKTTCLDWRNIWLNEGFADFSDELYTYHERGRSSFLNLMNDRASTYFTEEAGYTRPVYDPPMDHLFDEGHTYDKGSWVQHMLRYVEGDTIFTQPGIFFRAMRTYSDSFKYGNANTDDYCRIQEKVTGLNLGWFFNEWIYQAGYPQYTINWHAVPVGPNYQVLIDIAQSNGAQAPNCFHMPLQFRIVMLQGETLVTVQIDTNPQQVSFTVSSNPTAIGADPGKWVLGKATVYLGIEDATASELAVPLAAAPTIVRTAARVRYTVARPGPVELSVYDGAGRKVRTLVSGKPGLGTHYSGWDATDDAHRCVAPGVYFCRLSGPQLDRQVKLVVAR